MNYWTLLLGRLSGDDVMATSSVVFSDWINAARDWLLALFTAS